MELSINMYVKSLTFEEPKIILFDQISFGSLQVWVLLWVNFHFYKCMLLHKSTNP